MEKEPRVNLNLAELFYHDIQERQLPILKSDAAAFVAFHTRHRAPDGFFSRVLDACQYLDAETFHAEVTHLTDRCRQFLQDKPYVVALYNHQHSGEWIYSLMVNQNLPPGELFEMSRYRTMKYPSIKQISADSTVLVIDDYSISGNQLCDIVNSVPKGININVFLIGITDDAKNYVANIFPHVKVHTQIRIHTLGDYLTTADFEYLERIAEISHGLQDLYADTLPILPIFWSAYSTPDNIPDIFTGLRIIRKTDKHIPTLIRPITPHYRQLTYSY